MSYSYLIGDSHRVVNISSFVTINDETRNVITGDVRIVKRDGVEYIPDYGHPIRGLEVYKSLPKVPRIEACVLRTGPNTRFELINTSFLSCFFSDSLVHRISCDYLFEVSNDMNILDRKFPYEELIRSICMELSLRNLVDPMQRIAASYIMAKETGKQRFIDFVDKTYSNMVEKEKGVCIETYIRENSFTLADTKDLKFDLDHYRRLYKYHIKDMSNLDFFKSVICRTEFNVNYPFTALLRLKKPKNIYEHLWNSFQLFRQILDEKQFNEIINNLWNITQREKMCHDFFVENIMHGDFYEPEEKKPSTAETKKFGSSFYNFIADKMQSKPVNFFSS